MPGSSVVKPPGVVERPGSKRGGAIARSAALSEVCSVVKAPVVGRGERVSSLCGFGGGHGRRLGFLERALMNPSA